MNDLAARLRQELDAVAREGSQRVQGALDECRAGEERARQEAAGLRGQWHKRIDALQRREKDRRPPGEPEHDNDVYRFGPTAPEQTEEAVEDLDERDRDNEVRRAAAQALRVPRRPTPPPRTPRRAGDDDEDLSRQSWLR